MLFDMEMGELTQSIAQQGLSLIEQLKNNLEMPLIALQEASALDSDSNITYSKFIQALLVYWREAIELLENHFRQWELGESLPIPDKRFFDQEWLSNPFFNLLGHQYILARKHADLYFDHLEHVPLTEKKKIQFFINHYLDAFSPTNYIYTNPAVLKETIQSQGKNLIFGLHQFLQDLGNNPKPFPMKMNEENAFEIGKNIAATPGKIIYKNHLIELIQYTPQTSLVHQIPLLIIPPWINKYYILDLSPHNSLVNWLVKNGITVFMISWVNPDSSYSNMGLEDYLNSGPLAALNKIKENLKIKKINTLGFCIGGTLLSILAAYLKAKKNDSLNSATFLASLIDFSDPGDLGVFLDETQINLIETRMQDRGIFEANLMSAAFNSLRANDLIWGFFVNNYLKGKPPPAFDILYWNSDSTHLPAKMHSEYLRNMYLMNNLIKPNQLVFNQKKIDIRMIDIPTFFVATEKDHIAPWRGVYSGLQYMQGPKTFILGESGHIAGVINSPRNTKYGYFLNEKTESSSDQWKLKAEYNQGSWWPEWLRWLKLNSGFCQEKHTERMPSRFIEDAPGTYVKRKAE